MPTRSPRICRAGQAGMGALGMSATLLSPCALDEHGVGLPAQAVEAGCRLLVLARRL